MRSDAVRNQQRVVDAAREVLAEHGTAATMELIAAHAGVGVGTVYRHFPTKDALVDELVQQIFSELIAAAQSALGRADGDGLEELLYVLGRSFADHHSYAHLLVGRVATNQGAGRLRRLIAQLLAEAQDRGRISAEVTLGDIMSTVWGIRGVIETSASVVPRAWVRHLDLHLAALRSAPVSAEPPISAWQLARITNRR